VWEFTQYVFSFKFVISLGSSSFQKLFPSLCPFVPINQDQENHLFIIVIVIIIDRSIDFPEITKLNAHSTQIRMVVKNMKNQKQKPTKSQEFWPLSIVMTSFQKFLTKISQEGGHDKKSCSEAL